MLPLQRKIRDYNWHLKLKALAGAVVIYGFMIFFIFFSTYQSRDTVSLTVKRQGANGSPVLFMTGAHKRGTGGVRSDAKKAIKPQKVIKKVAQKKPLQKKVVKKPIIKKPVQKKQLKKVVKKTTVKKQLSKKKTPPQVKVKPKKAVPRKPEKNKPIIKEPVKKAQPKKKLEKKLEKPQEQLLKKKKTVQQSKPKKAEIAKKDQKKKLSLKPQKSVEKKVEQKQDKPQVSSLASQPDCEELYVSEGYDGGTKAHIALSRAIGRNWHPPKGLGDDLSSRLQVHLKPDGTIEEVAIEERSGVLAYDLAARGALWRVEYPREFWGKTVAISFGGQR